MLFYIMLYYILITIFCYIISYFIRTYEYWLMNLSHAGGPLQECYVTKRGYPLECGKPLHGSRGGGGGGQNDNFPVAYFLNDPLL